MSDSAQNFVGRNRPPRVHITYKLETGDAEPQVELPFVMNILSDLKGKPQEGEEYEPLEAREFTRINSMEDFRSFMRKTKPRVSMQVKNTSGDGGDTLPVDLTFNSMEDFSPARIAEQVEGLRELLEARNDLKHLLQLMDGRPKVDQALQKLMKNENLMKALADAGVSLDDSAGGDTKDGA